MMSFHADIQSGSRFPESVLASQQVFRDVMNAMARPGSIQTIGPTADAPMPLMPSTAAVALALFDHDTAIWADVKFDGTSEIVNWLRFQTGAPLTADASRAAFALISNGSVLPAFDCFAQGTPEYPDRSTTLIVQVETLTDGPELTLSGPGIRGATSLRAGSLPPDFAERMLANRSLFPQGIDLLLVCGAQLIALPRTVHITAKEA